jgi:hypothetical protein
MEEQRERSMEEVARAFSEALVAAYDNSIREGQISQLPDPELASRLSKAVISHLEGLAANPRGGQESTEESVDSVPVYESMGSVHGYMEFLQSMVSEFVESDRRARLLSME